MPGISGPTDSPKAFLLDCAEQLDLNSKGEFPNLIEKQRASIRSLEEPLLVLDSTRECAFDVAEELGFEERLRNRRAVDRHKGLIAAPSLLMDRTCNNLLARSALSADQYIGLAVGNLSDQLGDSPNRGAVSDD